MTASRGQQAVRINAKRLLLIHKFGGLCQVEGCQSHVRIEFHHVHGWEGEPLSKINPSKRLWLYFYGLLDGSVKLHCQYHHRLTFNYAGRARRYKMFKTAVAQPF